MGRVLPLLLLLPLLPTSSLQAGKSARCSNANSYELNQPEHLSAPKGGSIEIHFSFCYHWKSAKHPNVRISWRRNQFHGTFFYNMTPPFTHKDYKDRVSLNLSEGKNSGFLRIVNLREKDNTSYFCRVQLDTQSYGTKEWQSISGTRLTITHAVKTTTRSPTTTTGTKVTERKRRPESLPLSLEAVVGVALATVVFVTTIFGLIGFFRWKRRKGQSTKAQGPASELFPDTEEKYENVGYKGQHIDLKVRSEDDIVYASLTLSNSTLPGAAPHHSLHGDPPENTLYSVPKARNGTE